MKNRIAALVLGVAALAVPAVAQNSQLPLPSPVEKELAAQGLERDRGDAGQEHAGVCRQVHERQG